MKKAALATAASLGFLASAVSVFAQSPIPIKITPPAQGVNPLFSVGQLLTNAILIIFVVATLIVLFMLIIGAFQWITSGGEKEAVGKARGRITSALIGLAILALAFLITRVVGQLVGIDIFNLPSIPSLAGCPEGLREVKDTATNTITCQK